MNPFSLSSPDHARLSLLQSRLQEIFKGRDYPLTVKQAHAIVDAVFVGELFMLQKMRNGRYKVRVQNL